MLNYSRTQLLLYTANPLIDTVFSQPLVDQVFNQLVKDAFTKRYWFDKRA